jgi:hypothetical protein
MAVERLPRGRGLVSAIRHEVEMTSRDEEYLLLPVERDLRLDFFRGIEQWMVFLNHIPFDVVNWLT